VGRPKQRVAWLTAGLAAAALAFLWPGTLRPALGGTTERVSVASDGTQGNDDSGMNLMDNAVAISADGRCVAFVSDATNLVPGDTNGADDIFVHDRVTHQTTRVSVASDGTEGTSYSGWYGPDISDDGRFVAFSSVARDLVPDDTNGKDDVFVHDCATGQTTRVSVGSGGTQANNESRFLCISGDGRFVAFQSYASNLVAGDTNGFGDVFVHDRQTGQTTCVSMASGGAQGNGQSGTHRPAISADGRFVAFPSDASNLVPGDTNGVTDVFVHDRQSGQTTRVSVASDGTGGDGDSWFPSLSADGRFVAFQSDAGNLVADDTNGMRDIFVHDRQTGQTARVSVATGGAEGRGDCSHSCISDDGRFVAFVTGSALVPGDANQEEDIFVHDRATGQTARLGAGSGGGQPGVVTTRLSVNADGRFVAFDSLASDLVPNDTNGKYDVFAHDRTGGLPLEPYVVIVTPLRGPPGTPGSFAGADFGAAAGSVVYTPRGGSPMNWDVTSWSGTAVAFRVAAGTPIGHGGVKLVRTDAAASREWAFEVTRRTSVCADDGNATGVEFGTEPHPFNTLQEAIALAGGTPAAGGSMWAWGDNSRGQFGDGTTTSPLTPIQVPGLTGIRAIATGSQYTVALQSDGTVLACGRNEYGQLGDGSTTDRQAPVQVPGLTGVAAIAAGDYHTVALKSDGTVWAWGDNVMGKLGDGTTTERHSPVQVARLTGVVAVAAGGSHTVALRGDGRLWAWGSNVTNGQVGSGTPSSHPTPFQVANLTDVRAIAAGDKHSAAVRSDGSVWTWGHNFYGELGDGSTTDRRVPVQVPGLTQAVAVAAGDMHTLALKSDGSAWAWGDNGYGQLGDASTADRHSPVQVYGLSGAQAIAAGSEHSMALKTDGTVWGWGRNGQRQLGDGTFSDRTVPGQTLDVADAVGIAAATTHSVAVTALRQGGIVKGARGTYAGSITIAGVQVTLRGGYLGGAYPGTGNFDDATRNPDPSTNQTVVDGGGAPTQVACQDAAAQGSTLDGLTFRNGGATFRGGVVLRRVIARGGP